MELSGKARLAGVMGWPISHSRSPRLHGFWLQRYGVDGAYLPLAVAPEDLAQAFRLLPRIGFRGFNLTAPHKERALELVDEATPVARRIGAVNTVVRRDDGSLEGDNTDAYGFIASLTQQVPDWRASDGPAVVLGAGGAARAVVSALIDAGCPCIILCNRTDGRAEALAEAMGEGVGTAPWTARADCLDGAALLVNTTTQGMQGQPPLDLDLSGLPATAAVNDIVYVPLQTDLLARAEARGLRTADGLGMLLHQARPGFSRWFDKEPEVDEALRRHVLASM